MVIIGSLLKLIAKLNFQHAVEKSWYYLLHCLAQVSQLTKKNNGFKAWEVSTSLCHVQLKVSLYFSLNSSHSCQVWL